jgi:hypothetical protein
MGSAGIITVTIVGLLFLAIVVLAVRMLLVSDAFRDWREARYWKQMGNPFTPTLMPCEHAHCKMHVSDVGVYRKGRYAWVVCLDCGHNLTGGPLRIGDAPERGWR